MTMTNHALTNMLKQQLRTNEVLDEKILNLFDTIPRAEFVPKAFHSFAYSDYRIPLPHGQHMLIPAEEGKILQNLNLQGHETVLEIGTGSGYMTVLLSKLAKHVTSIDYFSDFTEQAKKLTEKYQCDNVELLTGDAYQGWLEKAPYDIMVITGGIENISDTLKLQVMPGGKLFAIVGQPPVMYGILYSQHPYGDDWSKKILFETNTSLLIDRTKTKPFVF